MTPTRAQILAWLTPDKLAKWYGQMEMIRTDRCQGAPYCWHYTGRTNDAGYVEVSFSLDGKRNTVLLHRLLYVMNFGDILDGTIIRHAHCGDRACCNALHFMAGTTEDNAGDSVRDKTIGKRRRRRQPTPDVPAKQERYDQEDGITI
jgi:hypothetical protein